MSAPNRRSSGSAVVSEQPYALASVTRADPPPEAESGDWHCYVITQGDNQIVGRRLGSADSVRTAALMLVEKLNDRRTVRNGRANLTIGPKQANLTVGPKQANLTVGPKQANLTVGPKQA